MDAHNKKALRNPSALPPVPRPSQVAQTRALPAQSTLPRLTAAAVMSPKVRHIETLQTKARTAPKGLSRPVPVIKAPIQRAAVMPYETWRQRSSKALRKRSPELLSIDQALMAYESTISAKREDQIAALNVIKGKVDAWIASKKAKYPGDAAQQIKASARLGDALKLKKQVEDKSFELNAIPTGRVHGFERIRKVYDLYDRVRIKVQNILAMPPHSVPQATAQKMTEEFAARRTLLRNWSGNYVPARAIGTAGRVLLSIGEAQLGVPPSGRQEQSNESALSEDMAKFRSRYKTASVVLGTSDQTVPEDIWQKLQAAQRDVDIFPNLANPQEEKTYFEPGGIFNNATNMAADITDITGNIGTGGKSNEGMQTFWNEDIPESAENAAAKEFAKNVMGHLYNREDSDAATQQNNTTSGVSDMFAAGTIGAQIVGETLRLWGVIKRCNATLEENPDDKDAKLEKNAAKAELALLAVGGGTALTGKFVGGALTVDPNSAESASNLFEAVNSSPTDASTPQDALPATSSDSDASPAPFVSTATDVKLAGDIGGSITSLVTAVKSQIETMQNIFDRAQKVKGAPKRGEEVAMDVFDSVHDVASTVNTYTKLWSKLTGLALQIQSGGQLSGAAASAAKDTIRGVVDGVPVVPVIGLIVSCLNLIKQVIKLAKAASAAQKAKEVAKNIISSGTESLFQAFSVTREVFLKQINRAIIDILHACAGVAAGALSVSGMGAGIGVAINAISAAGKLTQVGIRKFKQHMRDKEAPEQTNFELAHTSGHEGFHSHTLEKAQGRNKTKFNLDKSTANKTMRYNFAALEMLRAKESDQNWFFDALGIRRSVQDARNRLGHDKAKLNKALHALIIKALKER